jgi:hypothetical protein
VLVLKVAETDVSPAIVTAHEPVPLHAPPHPLNVIPDAAVAVSVTFVPAANAAEHVCPQLMPPGELVMVPFPEGLTVN